MHEPGKLVAVTKHESVRAGDSVSVRGKTISLRWFYDDRVTLACGCVYVYPRHSARRCERKRCKGGAS